MHEEFIRTRFNDCCVGKELGIEVTELREGYARGKLCPGERHCNVFGSVHGGVIFTFADHVAGACGNTMGKKAVLLESTIQYLRPVQSGDTIHAEADLVHQGRRIGRIEVRVYRERAGAREELALMHQVFFITDEIHKPPSS